MNWHDYFFNFARDAALKSKDPNKKVGCVIVDSNNRIISTGFNGFPQRCNEKLLSWKRPHKYGCVIHAELNAVLYAKQSLDGCVLYTTDAPCDNCLKHVIQAGIRKIWYHSADIVRKRATTEDFLTIRRLIKSTDTDVLLYPAEMEYITDLRISFPEEMNHPDGQSYRYKDLVEGCHYIVSLRDKGFRSYNDKHFVKWIIAAGVFVNKQFECYENESLIELLEKEFLTLDDVYFIKI